MNISKHNKKEAGRNCFRFFFFFFSLCLFIFSFARLLPWHPSRLTLNISAKWMALIGGDSWWVRVSRRRRRCASEKEKKERKGQLNKNKSKKETGGGFIGWSRMGGMSSFVGRKLYRPSSLYTLEGASVSPNMKKKKESNNKKRKAGHTNLLPLSEEKMFRQKSPASLPCWLYGAGSARLPNF